MKNNKTVQINTNFKDMMYYWLKFIKPFHTLSEQPMRILSLLLYFYFDYKEKTSDEDLLWRLLFSYDTKVMISNELDVKVHTVENKLTELRRKKVISKNKIDERFIPNIDKDSKNFSINFLFNINDDK